jgi:hypothetical protein
MVQLLMVSWHVPIIPVSRRTATQKKSGCPCPASRRWPDVIVLWMIVLLPDARSNTHPPQPPAAAIGRTPHAARRLPGSPPGCYHPPCCKVYFGIKAYFGILFSNNQIAIGATRKQPTI